MTTEKAAVWYRVSSGGQDEENQVPEVERYCADHGYTISRKYEVHGKSAFKREHYPDWEKLVRDASDGAFSVVVIWKVDRLDRENLMHAVPMVNMLLETGARVEFVTQSIDLTTMAGRMAFAMYCETAHAESETKRDRTRIGHDRSRSEGGTIGRPAFRLGFGGRQVPQASRDQRAGSRDHA